MRFQLLLFFLLGASALAETCKDVNAIHELKISSSFKNTIQGVEYLPHEELYFSTQELKYGTTDYVSKFYKGKFDDFNGGSRQFDLLSVHEETIVKSFLTYDETFVSLVADKESKLSYLVGDETVAFKYPLEKENTYNKAGEIISEKKTSPTIDDISFEASRKQVQLVHLDASKKTALLLYFNEGSLKLVQVEFSIEKPSVTNTWATLLVPSIQGLKLEGKTHDSLISVTKDAIRVVATLHTDHREAFKTLHNIELNFGAMTQAPFLLSIDAQGKVTNALNVIHNSFHEKDTLHASGFDVRDNHMILVGNANSFEGLYFDTLPAGSFFTVVSLEDMKVLETNSLDFLCSGYGSTCIYRARDVTFVPDEKSTNLYYFAGDVTEDPENLFQIESRIFFSDGKTSLQYVHVGESGANVVRSLSRYASSEGEKVIADIYMDGPMSPPEDPKKPLDDQFRKVNAGFWLLDCTSPSQAIEIGTRIVFYTVVALSIVIFSSAVGSFSTSLFYELKKILLRRKRNSERDPLIVNA